MKNSSSEIKLIVTEYMLKILDLIYKEPGINISEISSRLNIPLSTTSTIIKQLKSLGIIEVKKCQIEKEIQFYGDVRKIRRYIRKVYPKALSCCNGTIIIPNIHNIDGSRYIVGVTVLSCPFYNECPHVGKHTMHPGKCKLYDLLPDEAKKKLNDIISKLQTIVEAYDNLKSQSQKDQHKENYSD